VQELTAHPQFRVMATMNPGGDFGKKELSPALRNRLTEIYVPPWPRHGRHLCGGCVPV
jgi:midasin